MQIITDFTSCCKQNTIFIAWAPVSGAKSYDVYNNDLLTANTSETVYSEEGLALGAECSFFVRAKNDKTVSTNSNTVKGTYDMQPETRYSGTFYSGQEGLGWSLDFVNIPAAVPKGILYIPSTIGVNAYEGTLDAYTNYEAGQVIMVKVKFSDANTGPSSLNINGLGAKPIVRGTGADLVYGDIQTNYTYLLVYDGTAFRLETHYKYSGTFRSGDEKSYRWAF